VSTGEAQGSGSGEIIRTGCILTNDHVISPQRVA
jgi:S1-C subfamily serine protease